MKDIGILCHSYLEDHFLFSNTVKMEGKRDKHSCDFRILVMSENVYLVSSFSNACVAFMLL